MTPNQRAFKTNFMTLHKDPLWRLDCILIIIAFAAICLILFSGCMSVDKAKTFLKEKGKLAEICAETYPPKDSTVFIKGDTVTDVSYFHDTLYQPLTDTIYTAGEMVVNYRPCPPTKVNTKRITDTIKETKWDVYGVAACKDQLAALKAKYDIVVAERDKARKQAKNRLWWVLLLVVGGGVAAYFKLKKKKK